MDANKLSRLRECNFQIKKCCLLCVSFRKGIDLWGTCKVQTYFHLKHKEERELSVHALGYCPEWITNQLLFYDAWKEFMED